MIDDFGILFSTIVILLVIVRAWQLDRRLPWFQPLSLKPVKAATRDPRRHPRG